MTERLNVRLGNPMTMSVWSFAMLLTGIFIGENWHPPRVHSMAVALAEGVFHDAARTRLLFRVVLANGVVDRPALGGIAWQSVKISANMPYRTV